MATKNIHRTSILYKTKALFLVFGLLWGLESSAQVTYTKKDSIKVENMLKDGLKYQQANCKAHSLMLYYGHKLKGIPYVAHTLEVNKKEQLIVNMRQMDCTTFTETVLALARTTASGSMKWADFCHNLQQIRYQDGTIEGYPSRNHYFFWWVESNKRHGIVAIPKHDEALCKQQTININWMTTHPDSYKMLKGNKQFIRDIREHEKQSCGQTIAYIPKENLGLSKDKLYWVHDGDILAICTNKKGLDTTHIGIAEWGSDGLLHLLNASQIHKKVVLEKMSLKQYMSQHPVQIGVWVIKPIL